MGGPSFRLPIQQVLRLGATKKENEYIPKSSRRIKDLTKPSTSENTNRIITEKGELTERQERVNSFLN